MVRKKGSKSYSLEIKLETIRLWEEEGVFLMGAGLGHAVPEIGTLKSIIYSNLMPLS